MTTTRKLAGTRIPRWTIAGTNPPPGFGEFDVTVPAELVAALQRHAPVPLRALLLAAHLKMLGAVSAEHEVLTGYRSLAGNAPVPCQVNLRPGSWRDLVDAVQVEPVGEAELARWVETELDLSALNTDQRAGEPPADLALQVCYLRNGDELRLCLRYRRDVATADHAARLAGYQLAALRLLAADLDAPHDAATLVQPAELHTHLHELDGPDKPLPNKLFVELFEEVARQRPDVRAATHGDRTWTYAELNSRANKVAHELLAHGLAAEDVVAVITDRTLDWLAALLGVLKAGGGYLPVRPDFPPDRVASQLDRSRCRFVVADLGSASTLRQVLVRIRSAGGVTLLVEDCYRRAGAAGDPRVPIGAGQLAYIYFTSGSTGEPKGAMCEHAGMLNHLYMKVTDQRLAEGDVVTQTASQCFDISLWQAVAPLLVGGSTMIVDTDVQLDVDRFIALLAAGGIHVIQVVPSYLDVLLARLERDCPHLGDLRSVSATGETLRLELVRRWLALYPEISLVNAYGATEVSDDTMHAVIERMPVRDFVPVGCSLRNVHTYVLDEHLRVAPLGTPGEIAFSGVCVGRGYINDPERTRQAFVADPYRPGTRMYRTGDFGRWLPEGTIEFLGRRDEQVKIRGFRIEIGEIESELRQMPGVGHAAVVVHGSSDWATNLVAFYTGSDALQPADLCDFLASSLPDYMIPAYFHRLDALPLTENGKVSKKTLTSLAADLARDSAGYVPPETDTERKLATAWAEVLNVLVGRIGRADDFFKLGGTSLAAVRLVVKLNRAVSLRRLAAHPVLRDLAAVLDATGDPVATPRAAGILQRLPTSDFEPVAGLVCFPYAGGNAVNFQLLAKELERKRIAVHAIELPGHDVANPDEPLAGVEEVARRVAAEIRATVPGPMLLWGHCAGAAHALEVARLLERDGTPVARLFVGALLLDDPDRLRAEVAEVTALSDAKVIAQLHEESAYIELDLLKSERAEVIGAAYRHDVCSTNLHLIAAQHDREWHRLRTPIQVVVAEDDPTTADHATRYRRWKLLAKHVELSCLDEGGHYFIQTRTPAIADLVSIGC